MTDLPAVGYLSDNARTGGEQKQAFEDIRDVIAELPGGSAEIELTITGGTITIPVRSAVVRVDTEADAAADDLDTIGQGSTRDGQIIILRPVDSGRVVTLKHGNGGTGQMLLTGATDLVLDSVEKSVMLRREGTAWREIFRTVVVGSAEATVANKVLNGRMTYSPRRTPGTEIGSANGMNYGDWPAQFGVHVQTSPQARATVSQSTDVPGWSVSPNSLKVDCTTAEAAVAAGEEWAVQSRISGNRLYDFLYGTTDAKTVTLAFDIKSPKAGTQPVGLYVIDNNKHFLKEVTVSSANVWEHFSMSIALPTTGPGIPFDFTEGLRITWPLVCGSTFQGTVDVWATGEKYSTSNQQNLMDNVANNFFLANVVLVVGDQELTIPLEGFDETMNACKRFYQKSYAYDVVPGTNGAAGGFYETWSLLTGDGTRLRSTMSFPVPFHDNPVVTKYDTLGAQGKGSLITSGGGTQVHGQIRIYCVANGPDTITAYKDDSHQGMPSGYGFALHWEAKKEL
jgi:hypothetical protein